MPKWNANSGRDINDYNDVYEEDEDFISQEKVRKGNPRLGRGDEGRAMGSKGKRFKPRADSGKHDYS